MRGNRRIFESVVLHCKFAMQCEWLGQCFSKENFVRYRSVKQESNTGPVPQVADRRANRGFILTAGRCYKQARLIGSPLI